MINELGAKPGIDRLKTALRQWLSDNSETKIMDSDGNFNRTDPIDISQVEFKFTTMGWRWY